MHPEPQPNLLRLRTLRTSYYPETSIDDFTRIDSTVEFYTRVGALIEPDSVVVDYGAGRGEWFVDGTSATRRRLRDFRGRARKVIGLDVDPVVASNPAMDETHVISEQARLPLDDESVDVVVSDFTFEHVADPRQVSSELDRVLRPGGWICARTPNKWGYIGLGARLVPNRLHTSWLTRLQPERKPEDVFPVCYRLNTPKDVRAHFSPERFVSVIYAVAGEPGYGGSSRVLWRAIDTIQRFEPRSMHPMLLMFLQKRGAEAASRSGHRQARSQVNDPARTPPQVVT